MTRIEGYHPSVFDWLLVGLLLLLVPSLQLFNLFGEASDLIGVWGLLSLIFFGTCHGCEYRYVWWRLFLALSGAFYALLAIAAGVF